MAKDDPATLRRLMAYLEPDSGKRRVYVAGALKNPRIPQVGNLLRERGYDALDDWWSAGEDADDYWQAYERLRGRTYAEALRGRAATNVFLFDQTYISLSDVFVAIMPIGKSVSMEMGYARGSGVPVVLFLDGHEFERYEVMTQFADVLARTETELLLAVSKLTETKEN